MGLNEVVKNIENKSSKYGLHDLVHVCKRKNNSKRDFLFVNPLQGKHIPQSPKKIISLYSELLQELKTTLNGSEKILVIGFAETATAIGNYIASNLDNVVWRLQTTREYMSDYNSLLDFREEHSHAAEQWLYSSENVPDFDRVVFVEDEISTGNTILNFIKEFEKIYHNKKYTVLSVLNWQSKEHKSQFKDRGIETVCLVSGEIEDSNYKLDLKYSSEVIKLENTPQLNNYTMTYGGYLPSVPRECLGGEPYDNVMLDTVLTSILTDLKKNAYFYNADKILVLGTEEYMYIPLKLAERIEKQGYKTNYHATTRSPITTSISTLVNKGITFKSYYDKERINYLYNLEKYDFVVIVGDKPTVVEPSFIAEIKSLLLHENVVDTEEQIVVLNLVHSKR